MDSEKVRSTGLPNTTDLENVHDEKKSIDSEFNEIFKRETNNKKFTKKYNITNKGLVNLFIFNNTIFKELFNDCIFWFNNIIYNLFIIFYVFNIKYKGYVPSVSTTLITLSNVNNFVSFILVFFISDCYKRYDRYISEIFKINNSVFDVLILTTTYIDNKNCTEIKKITNMCCKLNLACMMLYTKSCKSVYNFENYLTKINDSYQLISTTELNNVKDMSAVETVTKLMNNILLNFPEYKDNKFNEYEKIKIMKIFNDVLNLIETMTKSIPFVYKNLIYKITTLYLFFISIYFGLLITQDSNSSLVTFVMGSILVFFVNTLILGIIKIGESIYEPYDGDIDDFNVIHYSLETLNNSIDILYSNFIENNENINDICESEEI